MRNPAEIQAALRQVQPFRTLSESRLAALAEVCRPLAFPRQARIIARGEPGDSMYVVTGGAVRVVVRDDNGAEKFVTRLGVSECFGEMALLTGEPRSADVYAESDVSCLLIDKSHLQVFLQQNPSVAAFLTEILGKRLLETGQIRKVGKYRLIGELGRGGIAIVYEGVHPELQRTVAIKMLSHALVYDQEFASRFRNEAKIIAGLEHSNIVRVFDCEEAYATYFIIMEKVSGIDLTRMREAHGTLSEARTREILLQLASALDYAHSHGIIHRDIKPDNVILDARNQIKLMDFGIAKTRQEEHSSEEIIGTAEYMSPEQALGRRIDGRTDIYSLGIMAYELLTGRLPFESADPYEILRKHLNERMPRLEAMLPLASPVMCAFIDKATRKNPDERFASGAEIIDHFGGKREGERRALAARNLVVVFDPARQDGIEEEIARFIERAERLPGTRIKSADLGEL